MGIEEQIDRLIDLGEDIKVRLDRLIEQGAMPKQPVGDRFVLPPESEMNSITFGEAIKKAKNHFSDASKMAVDEPPKKWRILKPGEVVQEGDWVNAINNKPDEDPPGGGWIPARASVIGREASQAIGLYVARPVADEPAKEPEHSAGQMPDPGEGYRILSKEPPEELQPGDEYELSKGKWVESVNACTHKRQAQRIWYRRKIEQPEPAWEPKVGDWVRVTRPENWKKCWTPCWLAEMHQFDGNVGQVERGQESGIRIRGFVGSDGLQYQFHRDWLSPTEPPEPEYREPVLPGDCGKPCEFSDDSISWEEGVLIGWRANFNTFNWKSERDSHRYARIKKES